MRAAFISRCGRQFCHLYPYGYVFCVFYPADQMLISLRRDKYCCYVRNGSSKARRFYSTYQTCSVLVDSVSWRTLFAVPSRSQWLLYGCMLDEDQKPEVSSRKVACTLPSNHDVDAYFSPTSSRYTAG